jgi:transposase
MAAARGPASSLPMWIQFLLLWKSFHKRKNWLHVGSERAGPRVAAIPSVVETCRRHLIPIRRYLNTVLPGLAEFPANRVSELTPANWSRRRS